MTNKCCKAGSGVDKLRKCSVQFTPVNKQREGATNTTQKNNTLEKQRCSCCCAFIYFEETTVAEISLNASSKLGDLAAFF